jgi:hypothetical protein
LMDALVATKEVPFDKFVCTCDSWGVFKEEEVPDPSGTKANWTKIVNALDKHAQFQGDSFWRVAGPFRSGSNELIPSTTLKLRKGKLHQLALRDSEVAYVQVENLESKSRPVAGNQAIRSLKITASDASLQVGETLLPLRQYFESTLFFRAQKLKSLRPSEPVIEFATVGEDSEFPIGPHFKLPIRVRSDKVKLCIGCLLAGIAAVLAAVALEEDLTYQDVSLFAGALILGAIASALLTDKIKIGSGGD